jgi:hypothetical protein
MLSNGPHRSMPIALPAALTTSQLTGHEPPLPRPLRSAPTSSTGVNADGHREILGLLLFGVAAQRMHVLRIGAEHGRGVDVVALHRLIGDLRERPVQRAQRRTGQDKRRSRFRVAHRHPEGGDHAAGMPEQHDRCAGMPVRRDATRVVRPLCSGPRTPRVLARRRCGHARCSPSRARRSRARRSGAAARIRRGPGRRATRNRGGCARGSRRRRAERVLWQMSRMTV